MFDFSFAEIFVVFLVGLLVLGPKDLSKAINYSKNIIANIKRQSSELLDQLSDNDDINEIKTHTNEINEEIKTIIDLEGNKQVTYNLKDVMQEINQPKNTDNSK